MVGVAAMNDRFQLTIEAAPGWSAPAIVRLRKALKAMLRGYGLRCVDLIEVGPAKSAMASESTSGERSEAHTCEP
jgi:hypothetical protein